MSFTGQPYIVFVVVNADVVIVVVVVVVFMKNASRHEIRGKEFLLMEKK